MSPVDIRLYSCDAFAPLSHVKNSYPLNLSSPCLVAFSDSAGSFKVTFGGAISLSRELDHVSVYPFGFRRCAPPTVKRRRNIGLQDHLACVFRMRMIALSQTLRSGNIRSNDL
jgi:hypothetical protein